MSINEPTHKAQSDYMNEILDRLGIDDRAIPGQLIAPTFYRAFTAIIDRIEYLETILDPVIRLEKSGVLNLDSPHDTSGVTQ